MRQQIENTAAFQRLPAFKKNIYQKSESIRRIKEHVIIARTVGYDAWRDNNSVSDVEASIVKEMCDNVQSKDEALSTVEENNPDEHDRLYQWAAEWVAKQMKPFTAEDLKKAYYNGGNPAIMQPNVIGSVVSKLASVDRIKRNGYTKATIKTAHSRVIIEWISREYSARQSYNRSSLKDQTVISYDL